MRVIPNSSGWDIALDMVFTDKQTAHTIAERIRHGVRALICDAVDESMCRRKPAKDARGETPSTKRREAGAVPNEKMGSGGAGAV